MTVRTTSLRQRMSDRRLSFVFSRRSSSSVSGDVSTSYHHRGDSTRSGNSAGRRLSWRDSSLSEASTAASVDHPTRADAVTAADEKKSSFRESLPESLLSAHDYRDCIAPFRRDEVVLGPKLGTGEFSNVYEVQSFQLQTEFAEATTVGLEELDRRTHMKKYEKYRETKNTRYAVKYIKDEYHMHHGSDSYVQAAGDLALEAEFLASLQHPNIIKLRGISHLGAAGFMHGPSGYFLVIDRLNETLDQRLTKWRVPSKHRRQSSFRKGISSLKSSFRRRTISQMDEMEDGDTNEDHQDKKMDERYNIALQISAALVYLHSHSIIFRDLKPANIGFDVRGDVKIFDFGLARILPEDGCPNTNAFEMSGAGSPRYMAPECLSNRAYNLKADVYSFSIILWEILTAKTPYLFVRRRHQLINYVVEENGRPDIEESWPSSIQGMLESSFDSEIEKRPKMTLWYEILRDTLVSLRNGDRRGLSDTCIRRRRSFDSMRNIMDALRRDSASSRRDSTSSVGSNKKRSSSISSSLKGSMKERERTSFTIDDVMEEEFSLGAPSFE